MACLDTNVLVDLLRSPRNREHQRAVEIYRRLVASGVEVCTTRVCEAELRVGIYLAPTGSPQRENIEDLLARLIMLELDAAAAERFAQLKAHLQKLGRPGGDMDMLIASVASVNAQSLVTRTSCPCLIGSLLSS